MRTWISGAVLLGALLASVACGGLGTDASRPRSSDTEQMDAWLLHAVGRGASRITNTRIQGRMGGVSDIGTEQVFARGDVRNDVLLFRVASRSPQGGAMAAVSIDGMSSLTSWEDREGFRSTETTPGCRYHATSAMLCATGTPGGWEHDVSASKVDVNVRPAGLSGWRRVEFRLEGEDDELLTGSFDIAVEAEPVEDGRWLPTGYICGLGARLTGNLAGMFAVDVTESLSVHNDPSRTSLSVGAMAGEERPALVIEVAGGLDHPVLQPGFEGAFLRGAPRPEDGVLVTAVPRTRVGTGFHSLEAADRVALRVHRDPATEERTFTFQAFWDAGGPTNRSEEATALVELSLGALATPATPQPR
ncbi:MAG: hypothetical protein AB2A00_20750 [Myxococcota bacterium]